MASEEYSQLFQTKTEENQNSAEKCKKKDENEAASSDSSPLSALSAKNDLSFETNATSSQNSEKEEDEIDEIEAEKVFEEEDKKKMEEFKKLDLVRRIMREYDNTQTEDLTKEEFMKVSSTNFHNSYTIFHNFSKIFSKNCSLGT